jgi:hypothetical protein
VRRGVGPSLIRVSSVGARRNIQEVAYAPSCDSVAILSSEGFVRLTNVYEKSCNKRVTEQLKLDFFFALCCVSLFSLGFHLFSQENNNLMVSTIMVLAPVRNQETLDERRDGLTRGIMLTPSRDKYISRNLIIAVVVMMMILKFVYPQF